MQPTLNIGETGFEPATARPPAECATRLRHSPWGFHFDGLTGVASLGTSCLLCMVRAIRRCSRCKTEKPDEEFAWHRRERGQRNTYCRPCQSAYHRQHYQANKQRYIDAAARRKKALLEERFIFLMAYFRDHPCVDCGETDPIVLEFDHLRDKKFSISAGLQGRRWQDVLDEIAKCE